MRETLAALFLRRCGFKGSEPVVDPMCGSGTFVIEAVEIAAGLNPGRSRGFAFLIDMSVKAIGVPLSEKAPKKAPSFGWLLANNSGC